MKTVLWMRAETKPAERRAPLVPGDAKRLIDAGYKVVVEHSSQRAIAADAYAELGCEIAEPGTWQHTASDHFILGIKELPESRDPLHHRHIFFGHAYKGQPGADAFLQRFVDGDGVLLDSEFLLDQNGRRIAAFGYWAGFAGAAVGVMAWIGQQTGRSPSVAALSDYASQQALVDELSAAMAPLTAKPSMIVIGALGRCGHGACDLAVELGIEPTRWDMPQTQSGGPFPEILGHSIFVNSVLASPQCPVFVPAATRRSTDRSLTVIADVSCDPGSPYNPIPVYDEITSFSRPVRRVVEGDLPLDVIAVDHLPSMLPIESSTDYSAQLLPSLLRLNDPIAGVWTRAKAIFEQHTSQ